VTRTDLHRLLGQRWALPVLEALAIGPMGFNELKRAAPRVTARMLSVTLDALQAGQLAGPMRDYAAYAITGTGLQVLAWSRLLPVSE
jgi:hypothetical protein